MIMNMSTSENLLFSKKRKATILLNIQSILKMGQNIVFIV